jgi:hypothetical protein
VLGGKYHVQCNAILRAAAGIEVLYFGADTRSKVLDRTMQADQRRLADGLEDVVQNCAVLANCIVLKHMPLAIL